MITLKENDTGKRVKERGNVYKYKNTIQTYINIKIQTLDALDLMAGKMGLGQEKE